MGVKFFELVTLLSSDCDALPRLLADPRAARYAACCGPNASEEDRAFLDGDLPEDLCRSFLQACQTRYRLDGNWLRKEREPGSPEATLTALEVHDRFGAEALTAVEELAALDVTMKR